MFAWIAENNGTILITLALIALVALIVKTMAKDRKKGKTSCGCNCAHCAMHGSCHEQK